MPVTCTYDLEVVAAKYFYALEDGEVPLEFLFSGTTSMRRRVVGCRPPGSPGRKRRSSGCPSGCGKR
jgi:hypothetical protein